ncbi:MAG: acVLRF1 family peptidyl-tRNA hydrolase [Candidatus Dormiibacterota bacterium]
MSGSPAPGGRRRVEVAPERLARWLDNWAARHGAVATRVTPEAVTFTGADGGVVRCEVPFPPLAFDGASADSPVDLPGLEAAPLLAHVSCERTVAVLLARRGGHAVGVFQGRRLVASKVGRRLVHGRSAAGGWSQHRFERRRENQAREALKAAAADMARVLEPWQDRLDAVVTGGERGALAALANDPRLAPLLARAEHRVLPLPNPRRAVLEEAPDRYRAVVIELEEPA